MSKLIVEMDMNGIPDCCGLCDPLFVVVCATKHDQTIDKMMLRVGRPSWCPIKGEVEYARMVHERIMDEIKDNVSLKRLETQLPKEGEWIELTDRNERKYSHICSNCHRFHIDEGEIGYYHYCPNCGAKMQNEEE